MAFDDVVAARVRMALARRKGMSERRMFGGIVFPHNGRCGGRGLNEFVLIGFGEEGAVDALRKAPSGRMDFPGKPMKNMVYVDPAGYATDDSLRFWLRRAIAFASKLPVKE